MNVFQNACYLYNYEGVSYKRKIRINPNLNLIQSSLQYSSYYLSGNKVLSTFSN